MVDLARTTLENDPLVEARDLHVVFGSQPVLRGISLRVPRGQTLAIIGESGCGKTVFLKTAIGLVRPSGGEIYFDGRNLSQLNDRELTRERVRFGFVFQNAALFDSLTVGQNVAFPLRQHGKYEAPQVREMVLARLAEVGLPDSVVGKKPAELSGGRSGESASPASRASAPPRGRPQTARSSGEASPRT